MNALPFLAAAWAAGSRLTVHAGTISDLTGLGSAPTGMLLLAAWPSFIRCADLRSRRVGSGGFDETEPSVAG
jgi:hypothetical protein